MGTQILPSWRRRTVLEEGSIRLNLGVCMIDVGAQWVHGEKGNCVYEMVKDLNLLETSFNNYQDNTYYLSNGKSLDKRITDALFMIAMSVINDEDEAKLHPGTFGEYFKKVYYQRIKNEFGSDTDILSLAKIFEEWTEKFFRCVDSTETWYDVSNIGPFAIQKCEGDQLLNWKNKGYRTILYVLMKKFPDITKHLTIDDKIHLNKEVTKIVWDNNDSYNDGATVTCSDGSSYNADHVIITVSVGVLKIIYKNVFIPELPAFKTNAIEGITLGTIDKIFIKFPAKWWPDDLKGFSLLWTEEDKRKLRKDFPHGPNVDGRSWLEDVF
ncbi:peroxisomal N(1)-acetyl-spermine/spermidine oxidase [Aethina tumida]|uniref:peroxisomal N(1)-acetyl-spermine/spermidine oxidase n=1 Tax=Aethina tumida TaxID=116153 RepID=UPI0021497EA6|nr:peroxisomal N(1)-acetyl-spermine/spermidine oxidase [Aethina tumida]